MSEARRIPNVLSIAASDPSGGAGIQADLKTFAANGVYGMAAITALTVQNSRGVMAVELVRPEVVAAQVEAVLADIRVDAVKLGMLATAAVVRAVADLLARCRPPFVVLDPVLAATSGHPLLDGDALAVLRDHLFPLVDVLTPNLPEAGVLTGGPEPQSRASMRRAAERLLDLGPMAVLVKGGHLAGSDCPDLLVTRTGYHWFEASRIGHANVRGTGCTLSAAIAAHLACSGDVVSAVRRAKAYMSGTIAAARALRVGNGDLAANHMFGAGGR